VAAGTEPVLSAAVETTIRRAGAGRGLAFFRPIDPRELLVAAVIDPALAALVAEATIETEELDALLAEARALAVSRRNELVTVDHVLSVLLDASWFDAALRAVRADPRDLHWSIEARLAVEARSPSLRRVVRMRQMQRAISRSSSTTTTRRRWSSSSRS
jgi:Clp amino terminal domain, pathogenicity island component